MPAPDTHPQRYSETERDQALLVLARHNGNAYKAVAELAEYLEPRGKRVPSDQTLYDWRDKHAKRYLELREEVGPELEREAVATYREIAINGAHGQLEAIEQARQDLKKGRVKDAGALARNLGVANGVAIDKLLLLTNRPTQRVETMDANAYLDKLVRALGPGSIDSTAEDITNEPEPAEPKRSLASSGE